ncbi:O-antigen ligase domain-containing protein [Halieaceae bacterium IMCC14734]|uniref:O-antigen ligase domain-containing protein n=1 Tax=Candidatus Litorirhabdus singularis TaxID=2518993 RepID=A0ABT3TEF8_9GAMM|nr:O-antigen ligase family protein [Candidatus Litorirhabdus singularis]MCX2980389.1 O-antigen ligase domain-containing protein [Candidatus Litorirhabdus singularis]
MKQAPGKRLETALFAAFMLTLVWAPLPFASNRPWATALLAALLVLIALAYLLATMSAMLPVARSRWRRCRIPLLLLLPVQIWACIQLIPLPSEWLQWLSPQAALWHLPAAYQTLSLDPAATRWFLIESTIVVLGFTLTVALVHSRRRVRLLLATLVFSGTLQAIYGSFMVLSGIEWGFFVEKYVNEGQATGTFINRNHFAGYMALCLSAGGALLISLQQNTGIRSWRERTRQLLQQILGPELLLRVCLLAMFIGLLLSRSRMGNAAFLAALCAAALVATCVWGKLQPRRVLVAGALSAVGLALALWFARGHLLPLQMPDVATEARYWSFQYAYQMLLDFRWTGSGGGSFYGLFPNYQGPEVDSFHRHAHNDYLEFGIELGLPALGLLLLFVGWAMRQALRMQSHTSDRLQRGVGFGITMACLWGGLHALVDFNLQIPAISLTLISLLGVIPAVLGATTSKK